jgi:hypothetical protein
MKNHEQIYQIDNIIQKGDDYHKFINKVKWK